MKKESRLKSIKNKKTIRIKITPIVKSLGGVAKLPKDYDYKKDYTEYLFKKYNSLK
jgi:hypothetical protein